MSDDERINFIWRQTSGTGMSDKSVWITTYPMRPMQFAGIPYWRPMSAEEYFNKITHNNQGNVKK